MSIRTFFFDETYYLAQNYADYQKAQYSNGIFRADDLKVDAAGGADPFALYINPGIAIINGRVSVIDANYNIGITPAETGKARFDIVALRLNVLEKSAAPVVLSGAEVALSGVTAENLPVLPTLLTGETTSIAASSTCDLPLHKVFVTSSKAVLSSMDDPDGYDAYAADMRTPAIPPIVQAIYERYDNIISTLQGNMNDFDSDLSAETIARETADNTLQDGIDTLKPILVINSSVSSSNPVRINVSDFNQAYIILDFLAFGQVKMPISGFWTTGNRYLPGSTANYFYLENISGSSDKNLKVNSGTVSLNVYKSNY